MSQKKVVSLNKKIISTFVWVAILPLLLLSVTYLLNTYKLQYKKLKSNNQRLAKLVAEYVNENLKHSADDLIAVKNTMEHAQELNITYDKIFEKNHAAHSHFLKLQFADENGIVQNVYPYDESIVGNDVSRQNYFKKTMELDDLYWSATYVSMQLDQAVVSVNIPFDKGVLTAVVSLEGISDIVQRLDIGEKSYLAIVDQNGYYIAHSEHEKVLRRDFNREHQRYIDSQRDDFAFTVIDKGSYEIAVIAVDWANWSVWIAQEHYEAYGVLYRNLLLSLLLLLLVAIVILKFARSQAEGINSIINSLMDRMRQVASGNYFIDDKIKRYDEINELRVGINAMVKAVLQRQEALRESHEKYRALYWEAHEAFMIVSPSEGFISANPATVRLFACENEDDFISLSPALLSPEYQEDGTLSSLKAQQMMDRALKEGSYLFEWTHKKKNGDLFYATVFLTKINYGQKDVLYATVRDITENKKMRELMVQTEKMMSIGNLAAGMAHEINNPLGVILQSTQNIKRRLKSDTVANLEVAKECNVDLDTLLCYLEKRQIIKFIDGIADVGKRAAEIVRNMLQFSRQSEKTKTLSSLSVIIDDSIELAQKDYSLETKYDFRFIKIEKIIEEEIAVACVKTEIEQVVFNLLKNAAQAFCEHKQVDSALIRIKVYRDENWAIIDVIDNGPGMNEDSKRRVFEPFFTTKPVGVGTGLGLSVCYFIITQSHSGSMQVESQLGEGTRFIIKLPIN